MAFDCLVKGGPGWPPYGASQGKQPFHRASAKLRYIFHPEDIVMIEDPGTKAPVAAVKKEQVVFVTVRGNNISFSQIVIKAANRGFLPFTKHARSCDGSAIFPTAVVRIFNDEAIIFTVGISAAKASISR